MKEIVVKSRHYRKGTIAFFILTSLFLLSGCVKEAELDEKVIVAMVGIDRTKEDTIRVTMGLIDTRSIEEKEEKGVQIYSSEGDTVFEAVRASISKIGRQPQWPYIKVIVFGPAFSKTDIVPILDFFNRNNEVQPNPKITFSHESAEEIVKLETDLANIPAVIVEDQFQHQNLVGYSPDIELYQFTEMMLSPEKVGFAAIIEKAKNNDKSVPKIEGTAVIKKGTWIGNLTKEETRGLLWVRKEVQGGIIVIPAIEGKGKIALEILGEGTSSIEPMLKNGELSININLEQLVSISEVMAYLDLNEENITEIKHETEKQISKEIKAALQKTQEWVTDIFGISRAVHRKYPKYYQERKDNWGESFSSLPIEVNATVDIKTMGLLRSLPSNN